MLGFSIKQIDKGVKRISTILVSEFLFEGKDKTLVADTGMDIFNFKKYLNGVVDKTTDLLVLNTHYHPDHSNGNHRFKEVYIGEKDMPFTGEKLPYDKLVEDISGAIYKSHPIATLPLRPLVKKLLGTKPGKTKYIPLRDGEEIDLGSKKLIVKELPGHTNGSIVLLDKDRRTVYTGDAVNMGLWFFTNPDMKMSEYADNLDKFYADIKAERYKKLVCSHTPIANRISFVKDYAKFARSIKPGDELIKFNVPGMPSPLCIKVKPSLKHLMMACFYFENQLD